MRIAIQWPRFGPYHLARLRACHTAFTERGSELIALETASQDHLYAWREEKSAGAMNRVQVFPERNFADISPREMERGVRRVLDDLQPDAVLIHTYSFPDSRACMDWCRRNRRGAVLMTDTKADDVERSGPREALKRQIIPLFDAALLSGQAHIDYFDSLGLPEARAFTGYSVVDHAYFAEAAEAARRAPLGFAHLPGLGTGRQFFLASGRFLKRKNWPGLIQAYAKYRARVDRPWDLVLLGDGDERPTVEATMRAHGAEGVTLAGFRQIDELPAYYARASAFVHPAFSEQWGLVVNEAMAAELPVIVSKRTGASALVEEGRNGFVFDAEDTDALAARMAALSQKSPAEYQAMREASAEIIASWTPEWFAEQAYHAAQVARAHADRPYPPVGRALLLAMRYLMPDHETFFAVES